MHSSAYIHCSYSPQRVSRFARRCVHPRLFCHTCFAHAGRSPKREGADDKRARGWQIQSPSFCRRGASPSAPSRTFLPSASCLLSLPHTHLTSIPATMAPTINLNDFDEATKYEIIQILTNDLNPNRPGPPHQRGPSQSYVSEVIPPNV